MITNPIFTKGINMATKASNQTTTNEMNINEMDFEALLKEEAELKARAEKIAQAKKDMAQAKKAGAYTEIKEAIRKYFDTVLTREELTTFLNDEQFIMPMVTQAPSGAKVGRRAISEADILFSATYTSEAGRQMKFKMDELTDKLSGGSKDFFATLKTKTFEELKSNFTKKFWEFAKTEDGKEWYEKHFAFIKADIANEITPKEAQAEVAATV